MIRAARVFAPAGSIRLALIDALVVTGVFFLIVRWTIPMDPSLFFLEEHGAILVAPVIVVLILGMYFGGLYDRKRVESRIYLLQQLGFSAGIALISQALLSYIHNSLTLPRNLALYGLLVSVFTLFCWRMLRDAMRTRFDGTGTVMILGTDKTSHHIASHIASHPALHLDVVCSLTNIPEDAVPPVLGTLEDVREVAGKMRPDLIIAGFTDGRDQMPVAEMVDLRYSGSRIEESGTACELICRHVSARDMRPSRMLFSTEFDARESPFWVFFTDLIGSSLLLVTGAPFALLYAVFLRLSDGKPAFQKSVCAGYLGKPFTSRQLRVEHSGLLSAVGRMLHLEVWPQLWNVLCGRMSMVGPRPRTLAMAAEMSRLLPLDEYRFNARPGITGWAQINLKKFGEPMDAISEVEYDLYYIRNQSVSLYSYILLHGWRPVV